MHMTKRSVKQTLGFTKDIELASFLGISKQAVSQMGEDEPLPEGRQWQVRALRPDVFPAPIQGEDAPVNRTQAANDAALTDGDGTELKDAA